MPEAKDGSKLPIGTHAGANILGAVAFACCACLYLLADNRDEVTTEHFAWLAVCVVAAAFSAACAAIAAVEARRTGRPDGPGMPDQHGPRPWSHMLVQ